MAHSNADNVRLSVAFLQWNASASVLISYFIPVLNILRNPEYIFNTQNEQVNNAAFRPYVTCVERSQ